MTEDKVLDAVARATGAKPGDPQPDAAQVKVWCDECYGTGEIGCDDPQCGDSTWDHACGARSCDHCDGHGFKVRIFEKPHPAAGDPCELCGSTNWTVRGGTLPTCDKCPPEPPPAAGETPGHPAERLAKLFHDAYEQLAPEYGYRTREASAKPWSEVPFRNRALMIATAEHVLKRHQLSVTEVPGWLETLGHNLRTQDNRITAHPIFVVQQRHRTFGFDPAYVLCNDELAWVDEQSDYNAHYYGEEEWDKAEEHYREHGEEPEGWARTGWQDTWEFVTACFTEQGCKDYIAANGHNLKEPRIYAESAHRNQEWQRLRAQLMGPVEPPAVEPKGRFGAGACRAKVPHPLGCTYQAANGAMVCGECEAAEKAGSQPKGKR